MDFDLTGFMGSWDPGLIPNLLTPIRATSAHIPMFGAHYSDLTQPDAVSVSALVKSVIRLCRIISTFIELFTRR